MLYSQFLRLFAILNREELKAFEKFLHSPFFGPREQSRQFFAYLKSTQSRWRPLYEEFQSHKGKRKQRELETQLRKYLGKKEMAAQLFPDEPYNDGRMRRVISECKKLLIRYLGEAAPKTDNPKNPYARQFREDLDVLRFYLQRGEFDLFQDQIKAMRKLEGTDFKDHQYYYRAFQLEEKANDFQIRTGAKTDTYGKQLDHLDTYFILYKLRMFCAMHTRSTAMGVTYKYGMLAEITAYVERENFLGEPLIQIYYLILQMERGKGAQMDYQTILDLLATQLDRISHDEARQIYLFVYNFLEREHRKPGVNFARESFLLIKRVVDEGVIYSEGLIAVGYFNAAVRVACRAGEVKWAEEFIWANEERIAGGNRKEVFDFALLTVLFFQKEYTVILRQLDQLQFNDSNYQIRLRVLKMKTLYEQHSPEIDSSEDFFKLVEAFRRFLKNKTDLRPAAAIHYGNFLNFAEKLGKAAFDGKELPTDFEHQVIQEETAEEEWLLEKIRS